MRRTCVVADLGGTNLRLARVQDDQLLDVESRPVRQFSSPAAGMGDYLHRHGLAGGILCLAVASPVRDDLVRMTNLDWQFSQEALRQELGLDQLMVINDYSAMAMAIPFLQANEKRQVGLGAPLDGWPSVICGPGTGLGVAHLVPDRGRWRVLPGEGGHVDFAPNDELEWQVHQIFARRYGHVSIERLLSGPGLAELYQAMGEVQGVRPEPLPPREVSRRAMAGECELCHQALSRFCAMLGSFCGDLALTTATFGGVYITGGIVPAILDFFLHSEFRQRFEAKGRYQDYNAAIPSYVITSPSPGLSGAAAWLRQALTDQQAQEDIMENSG